MNISKNKISVNLLCLCIIILLGITVLYGLGIFTQGFLEGFNETEQAVVKNDYIFFPTQLTPESMTETPDSITAADGRHLPIFNTKGSIGVPLESVADLPLFLLAGMGLLSMAIFVYLIVQFVKLIVNFNRGRIFETRNCRYLNRIGVSMIILAVLSLIVNYGTSRMIIDSAGGLRNYSYADLWTLLPSSDLLVGFLALLFAQIWKRGIAIKNENELTV